MALEAASKVTAAEMEAFFAATKAQPRSEDELASVLADLPRRVLQALSKAHGVKATLKRESLVEKLVRVLKEQLWPTGTSESASPSAAVAAGGEDKDEVHGTNVHMIAPEETTTVVAETAVEVERSVLETSRKATAEEPIAKKTNKQRTSKRGQTAAAKVGAVGKKPVVQRKANVETTPARTPTKVKVASGGAKMDKIHAKQIAKQPTLLQHEQAKKERAAVLLSGSKYSAVKKTRSRTKDLMATAVGDKAVKKTLSFGSAKTKLVAPPPEKSSTPTAKEDPAATSAPKPKSVGYKRHVGPLPAFTGDSLFSPKKVEPRPAPMSIAVMKAARITTPKKIEVGVRKPTIPKVISDKENSSPTARNSTIKPTDANTLSECSRGKTATTVATTKPVRHTSIKAAATEVVATTSKKQERRTKFAHESKQRATASRRTSRSTPATIV